MISLMPAIRSQAAPSLGTVRCFGYHQGIPLSGLVIFLGLRTAEEDDKNMTPDGLKREVTVSPSRVFVGEKMKYPVKITFVAPGPMYGGDLEVTIPAGFAANRPFNGPFGETRIQPDTF